jgi:hypothetical protein
MDEADVKKKLKMVTQEGKGKSSMEVVEKVLEINKSNTPIKGWNRRIVCAKQLLLDYNFSLFCNDNFEQCTH